MNILNTYKVIVLTADTKNLSTTAEILFTVPSNISRIIRKQENELGFLIFNRINKNKLELTDNGKIFVKHAKEILQKEDEFYSNFDLYFSNNRTIRIDISHFFTSRFFELHYNEFQKIHPDIRFTIISENNNRLLKMLEDDLIDAAIVHTKEGIYTNYEFTSSFDLTAHFYTTDPAYKDRKNVKASDKIFKRLIVPYNKNPLLSLAEKYFSLNNIKMNPIIVTNNIPVLFNSVLNDDCTALIFDKAIQSVHLEDVLYPIDTGDFTFNIMMYLLTTPSKPIVAEYINFIKQFSSNDE